MTLGIILTAALGVIALWLVWRLAVLNLAARLLGRDLAMERLRRRTIGIALTEVSSALAGEDRGRAGACLRTAIQLAADDGNALLREIGFETPPVKP